MCLWVHTEASCLPQLLSTFFVWISVSLDLALTDSAICLDSKPLGTTCLYLCPATVLELQVYIAILIFLSTEDLNSGPYVHIANILVNEHSPPPAYQVLNPSDASSLHPDQQLKPRRANAEETENIPNPAPPLFNVKISLNIATKNILFFCREHIFGFGLVLRGCCCCFVLLFSCLPDSAFLFPGLITSSWISSLLYGLC